LDCASDPCRPLLDVSSNWFDGWVSHWFHIDRWWNEAVENQAGNGQLGGGLGMTEWTGVGTLFGVSPFDCDAGSH
jgi:hypothetical protein